MCNAIDFLFLKNDISSYLQSAGNDSNVGFGLFMILYDDLHFH